ncbi:ufm1-specific protease 2 [Frankliniella occidentalis]|uniref:Ufm1-specific protease 2 n=1 Tax=Frankliniella occidentalis TaxID=133901 RepID=A0A6J1SNR0_FRAOC|nr:ufm1-specific protease 2 [Frankliniella occidentalis]
MSYLGSLMSNPHVGTPLPDNGGKQEDAVIVKGVYDYFHYNCDGFNDVGWGCGYRTLQTICSWILRSQNKEYSQSSVPSIPEIQKILVDIGDKPENFYCSREWIGSIEVGYVLNKFNVDFRILHVTGNCDWAPQLGKLSQHFQEGGCPVMMGGKTDAAAKCVIGTYKDDHLLILDPHLTGRASMTRKLISWHSTKDFPTGLDNFYNLCIPLLQWQS